MDVDVPSKEVQFSSDNASGKKRSAADLPVEAQDNLPWCAIAGSFLDKKYTNIFFSFSKG